MNHQKSIRPFVLDRHEDESGVSGTGVVAEGVEFSDGHVALRWVTRHGTWGLYESVEVVEEIHGHNGKTKVHWLDEA
jgi:hypothetical protein